MLISLQNQAVRKNGRVELLLGNHEVMFLSGRFDFMHPTSMSKWLDFPRHESLKDIKEYFELHELLNYVLYLDTGFENKFAFDYLLDVVHPQHQNQIEVHRGALIDLVLEKARELKLPEWWDEENLSYNRKELKKKLELFREKDDDVGRAERIRLSLKQYLDGGFLAPHVRTGSVWGRLFAERFNASIMIDRAVFVHGGFTEAFINSNFREVSLLKKVRKVGVRIGKKRQRKKFELYLSQMNKKTHKWMMDGSDQNPVPRFLAQDPEGNNVKESEQYSPLWNSSSGYREGISVCASARVLNSYGIERMFVGHKPQDIGSNCVECAERDNEQVLTTICRVDTLMFDFNQRGGKFHPAKEIRPLNEVMSHERNPSMPVVIESNDAENIYFYPFGSWALQKMRMTRHVLNN